MTALLFVVVLVLLPLFLAAELVRAKNSHRIRAGGSFSSVSVTWR